MKQPNLIDEIIVDCFAGGVTVASLFDGIGGTPLSARINGAECVWSSEIEPFPIKVTKHHFPNVKHLGNITKINGAEVEPVDIIVGGSPCQDLSVAGKRKGMKHADFGDEEGTRSGLFMEQIRIIKEMRHASDGGETIKPRFMVWENVPGAFSSNDGEDFRAVLEETARVADPTVSIPRSVNGWANAGSILADGFTISWRTVDAQYWGVLQRRRRIYLVADFRGQSAPEILFEREGMPGDIAESGSKGKGIARDAEGSVDSAICYGIDQQCGKGGANYTENVSPTILSESHGTPHAVCYGICSDASNSMKSSNPHSGVYEADTSRTLDQNGGNPACNQGGIAIVSEPTLIEMTSTKNTIVEDGICPTLTARMGTGGNQVNAICSSVGGFMQAETERTPTLMARDYKDPHIVSQQNKQVRRLTPLETERLQGYLDGWTDIPPQKEVSVDELRFWRDVWDEWDTLQDHKKHSDKQIIKWLQSESADASRYKANGNSFAIPNASFAIGRCITTMREFRAKVREEAI